MDIIHTNNDGVIYMGVSYNKDQWEVKLKELKDTTINKLIKQNDYRPNKTI